MIVVLIRIALLALLVWAAFKVIWKAVVAACAGLVDGIADLVGKLKVAIRRGKKAIIVLYRSYRDGRKTSTQIGQEEDVDVFPDEVRDALDEQEQVILKDEETGW